MMVSTAEANEGIKSNSIKGYFNYYGTKPIKFTERGIKFFVFPNGDVDYNTHSRNYRTQYYHRNGRRYSKRIPQRGVKIDRDYYGRDS